MLTILPAFTPKAPVLAGFCREGVKQLAGVSPSSTANSGRPLMGLEYTSVRPGTRADCAALLVMMDACVCVHVVCMCVYVCVRARIKDSHV